MKIIAIYHNKGGVGKTTVSVNLAAALRKMNYRVLLIDLDAQANSTFATGLVRFQLEEEDNLKDSNVYHVLRSADYGHIHEIARRSIFFNTPEIDVIPAHINLVEREIELGQINTAKIRLGKKLEPKKDYYDFVIIDSPPARDLYAEISLISADYLIIPSDLKPFANQGLSTVTKLIDEVNCYKRDILNKEPIKVLGVLPSKISTNQKFFTSNFVKTKESVLNKYKFPIMNSIIFDRVALAHCFNQTIEVGEIDVPDPKSIFDYAKENAIASEKSVQEFNDLAREVLENLGCM